MVRVAWGSFPSGLQARTFTLPRMEGQFCQALPIDAHRIGTEYSVRGLCGVSVFRHHTHLRRLRHLAKVR